MQVWKFIHDKLKTGSGVILLWVLDSEGSSPGRKGFRLAVANDHSFCGTIGGGMMEHKLVEKAKTLLTANENSISLVRQFHDKQHDKDQSGMICSGSQMIAFVPLFKNDLPTIEQIIAGESNRKVIVQLSLAGINLMEGKQEGFIYKSETEWTYSEAVDQRPVIHIIGGGHVGLALSELMSFLGFYITVYDNRPGLNTMENNRFAHEKHFVDYNRIAHNIKPDKEAFVVIVTFSYRDDKIVFKQLLDKEFFYMGMMGSDSKIETLLRKLEEEGINPEKWKHCFVPIGINIYSKTTQEIAVSIAAQIIWEKNKDLPTGRSKKLL
ncbi:MAG: XdhC family protein [Bacteroidota bacterium]|nr:XdhC family protein [Bacteroidota bacterium]